MGGTDGKKKGPTISYSKAEGRRKTGSNSNSLSPPSKKLPPTLSLHVIRDASAENNTRVSARDQSRDGNTRRSRSASPPRPREKKSFSELSSEEDIIVMILSVIAIAHPEEIAQLTAQRISAVRCDVSLSLFLALHVHHQINFRKQRYSSASSSQTIPFDRHSLLKSSVRDLIFGVLIFKI